MAYWFWETPDPNTEEILKKHNIERKIDQQKLKNSKVWANKGTNNIEDVMNDSES